MKRLLGTIVLIMLGGCSLSETPEQELNTQADKALRIEAETFEVRPGTTHTWKLQDDQDASAGAVLRALPDRGKNYKANYRRSSPRLDLTLDVPAGTYYVWVRGKAVAGKERSSNSLHLGLDGEPKVEHVSGFASELSWSNLTVKGKRVKLKVPEGKRTLNVWMREDGFSIDSLFLTRDGSEKPDRTASTKRAAKDTDASLPAVKAKRADDFVDSIGVNTHLEFTNTVYGKFSSLIEPKLTKLGVRHVRDGAYTAKGYSRNHPYYEKCRALADEGVRFNLLVNVKTSYTKGTDFSKLGDIYEWCDGAVTSFEGLNEPDLRGLKDWVKKTKDVQKKLYEAVNRDSDLNGVKVLGPSVVWKTRDVGDLSSYLDYGSWHPYNGGNCPSCTDPYGNGLDSYLPKYREPSGGKPMVATETGYHNAVNMGATDHRPVSEEAAAAYVPRLFLEHFNRGIVRSYLYEFIDLYRDGGRDERDKNFGLLRNDGSEKPAYKALENLIDVLEDPGADFEPDALRYALKGATERVHSALLQKEDGTFYLALWQARSSYDTGARANAADKVSARGDRSVSEQALTLTLGTSIDEAALYVLGDDGDIVKERASLEGGEARARGWRHRNLS